MSLPRGWVQTTLGELITLRTGPFGSSLHQSDYVAGGTPLVNPMHIVGGRIVASTAHAVSDETLERLKEFQLSESDIVIARRGEMGRCAVVTRHEAGWLCGTGSMVIRCNAAILPIYLQQVLGTRESVEYLGQESVGSTMANLNQKILLSLPIRLPPVDEQQRILYALDEIYPGIHDAERELGLAKRKLVLFRQSLLKAAVNGTITARWRNASDDPKSGTVLLGKILGRRQRIWRASRSGKYVPPLGFEGQALFELPSGWVWASIDQVTQSSSYGTSTKCDSGAAGTPVLRIPNLRSGHISLSDLKYSIAPLGLDDSEYLCPGDVLVVRTNGSVSIVGNAAYVPRPGLGGNFFFASYLLRLRPVLPRLMGAWIATWLRSPPARQLIETMAASSAGQHNIGLSALLRLPIPIAPVAEMRAALGLFSEQTAACEAHDSAIAFALKMATAQRENILRTAFSGRIVPQDPRDEPASALLDRIRAQRQAAAPATKRKPGRRAKERS